MSQTLIWTSIDLVAASLRLHRCIHRLASPETEINNIYFQSLNMKASKKSNYWLLEAKTKEKKENGKRFAFLWIHSCLGSFIDV